MENKVTNVTLLMGLELWKHFFQFAFVTALGRYLSSFSAPVWEHSYIKIYLYNYFAFILQLGRVFWNCVLLGYIIYGVLFQYG